MNRRASEDTGRSEEIKLVRRVPMSCEAADSDNTKLSDLRIRSFVLRMESYYFIESFECPVLQIVLHIVLVFNIVPVVLFTIKSFVSPF